ncbi:MAG: branched-chain amino acid ABC transporter permease [Rhodomicrobium sp.]
MISAYNAALLSDIGVLILGSLSVYVILSTGQLSLGNAGFMAIGAYLASYLSVEQRLPITLALLASATGCAAIGIFIGFPALRLRGIYLAVATLGFGEMVRSFFLNLEHLGGAGGYHGMQPIGAEYIWTWTAGVLLLVLILEKSRIWLDIRAVHDDETAAGLVGLDATSIKVGAFGLGAFIAGLAGGLFAHHHLYIEPGNFGTERSIEFVLATILGGSTLAIGSIIGSALLVLLPEWLQFMADWRLAAFGAMLVFMLLVRPQGLLDRRMFRWPALRKQEV